MSTPGAQAGTAALALLPSLGIEAWLVGGAVRDRLLGRGTDDFDIAVRADPEQTARALARAAGGHAFMLSGDFGSWRVVSRREGWQIDVSGLTAESIEGDLARRDLTLNAIAEPAGGGELVDPFSGRRDLAAGRLRMVSAAAFADDPLRVLRLARLAAELGFAVDADTVAAARRSAPGLIRSSPERVFAELKRLVGAAGVLEGLRLMHATGATAVVLPELAALQEVAQNRFHHLDVHDHTLCVLEHAVALELDPQPVFGEASGQVTELLAEPLADGLSRGSALRFAALLHDIAKPQTRGVTAEGRVTFIGHDAQGAHVARTIMRRLRAAERVGEHVAALTLHHLRLGFLVHRMPLSRGDLYTYLRTTDPVAADVTVLSVADRLATRGDNSERAIELHLRLAREVLGDTLAWRRSPPRPPLRGDELASELGLKPGPQLGRLLSELERASFTGEIAGRQEAIALARSWLTGEAAAERNL